MAGTWLVAHSEDSIAAGLAEHSEHVEPTCRHQRKCSLAFGRGWCKGRECSGILKQQLNCSTDMRN